LSCLSARRFLYMWGTVLLFRFICPVCTRCIICRSTLRVYHSYPYLSIGSMNFRHIAQSRYIFTYRKQANCTQFPQIYSCTVYHLVYYCTISAVHTPQNVLRPENIIITETGYVTRQNSIILHLDLDV
jgi:hypothetical protein